MIKVKKEFMNDKDLELLGFDTKSSGTVYMKRVSECVTISVDMGTRDVLIVIDNIQETEWLQTSKLTTIGLMFEKGMLEVYHDSDVYYKEE